MRAGSPPRWYSSTTVPNTRRWALSPTISAPASPPEFSLRYGRVPDLAWFDIVDVVGFERIDAWRWQDAGRPDITFESITAALDDFLDTAVARPS